MVKVLAKIDSVGKYTKDDVHLILRFAIVQEENITLPSIAFLRFFLNKENLDLYKDILSVFNVKYWNELRGKVCRIDINTGCNNRVCSLLPIQFGLSFGENEWLALPISEKRLKK